MTEAVSPKPKRIPPKPFVKGDPRINRSGRPKQLLTRAIAATLTDKDAASIVKVVIAKAAGGDLEAVKLLWDRLEGKAITRNENGDPGTFELDLSDISTEQIKAALTVVK